MATIRRGSTQTGALVFGPVETLTPVDFSKPPVPPMPIAPRATIDSFQTPIRLSETSRAVARVIQGTPARFKWFYQDPPTGLWLLVANNPASDLDHHYRFPRPGNFAIRLQTIDSNGQVSDQTATLRTVTVLPDAPTPVPPDPTPIPPSPDPSFRGKLHADAVLFRDQSGAIFRWRGVTAFTAAQLFDAGNLSTLQTYADWTHSIGASIWRVFAMWTVTGYSVYGNTRILGGLADWMRARGLYLHLVAFCDQEPGSRVLLTAAQRASYFAEVQAICQSRDNCQLEYVNEDWQNGQIAAGLPPTANVLCARSAFQDGQPPTQAGSLLQWTTEHNPRDAEWPRKGKNMLETCRTVFHTGQPAICGEMIGIAEQDVPGRRTANAQDCADYAATCELFSAGFNVHGDAMMQCQPPGPNGAKCVEAIRQVWAGGRIPFDAVATGSYTRGGLADCPLQHSDSIALRTFAMIQGNVATAVVVRPTGAWRPVAQNGWSLIDVSGPNGHIVHLKR